MKTSELTRPALLCIAIAAVTVTAVTVPGCKKVRPLSDIPGYETEAEAKAAAPGKVQRKAKLIEVAVSPRQWTGVAVSKEGRIFVNFPRWSDDVPVSVGEVLESGEIVPFPDDEWNQWDPAKSPDEYFICVQSVHVDRDDNLWVLDPANPMFGGVVSGGAKLLRVDIGRGQVKQVIGFDETIAPATSYLNDVRVDTRKKIAYITDSGLGAIIVVDLKTGRARRLLGGHASTKSEDVVLTIGGKEWRRGGRAPQVHSDGLALDPGGEYLYFQALTGRTLYRVGTRWLLDPDISERNLESKVESMYRTGAADGIEFGPDGYLYLTAIENDAIKMFVSLGKLETVAQDDRLKWPDSFARGPDGYMYVTTSQIHLGADVKEPYRIFKFKPLR